MKTREVAYRVWDKKEKKMIYDAESYPLDRYDPQETAFIDFYTFEGSYTLMQYIGLRDAKRKKIFEGDIVKVISTQTQEVCKGEVSYYEGKAMYVIEIDNGSFLTFASCDVSRVEVLGNIFENSGILG